mgnify:CR=1 FL=1|tara:strand:- start:779 stop:1492 length:714 start_codon:yes stop_codon:yes gene_type:complete
MLRNVYLHGELGERFGKKFSIHSDNYGDIIRCINANRPEFLPYLRQCHEDNIDFSIKVENEEVDEQEILLPIQKGDVSIAIVPAGAKSGVGKLIAAAFLVFVALPAIGGMVTAGATAGTAFGGAQGAYGMMMSAGFGTIGGKVTALLAVNLAMAGIQQMMAPDPAVDAESPTNYLFSGDGNNAKEGDPIPLLYGELRVPGRPISVNVIQGGRPGNNNYFPGGGGDSSVIGGANISHK